MLWVFTCFSTAKYSSKFSKRYGGLRITHPFILFINNKLSNRLGLYSKNPVEAIDDKNQDTPLIKRLNGFSHYVMRLTRIRKARLDPSMHPTGQLIG